MSDKIKNFLGLILTFAIIVFAVSAGFYVYSYSRSIEPSSFRSFSVTGEGKSIAIPDIAQVNVSVITEGGLDIGKIQSENTEKMNKIIAFLKENDVDKKDIKTQGYNLNPRYQHFRCEPGEKCLPPRIVGYSVNQNVQVKIRNFDSIGDILSGVIAQGANSVSQLFFTLDDPTEAENEARAEAIDKAKAKAKAIARAGGFSLGRLLSISEGGFYPPSPIRAFGGEGGGEFAFAKEALESPAIEPGSQESRIRVTLTYEIN